VLLIGDAIAESKRFRRHPLAGTREEVKEIGRRIYGASKLHEVTVLVGREATYRRVLREMTNGYDVVHLAGVNRGPEAEVEAGNPRLARLLVETLEQRAAALGHRVINLDVRDTQTTAIALFESLGYLHWGTHPHYARVRGQTVAGRFYAKTLEPGRGRSTGELIDGAA
jgi:hypothetical protein